MRLCVVLWASKSERSHGNCSFGEYLHVRWDFLKMNVVVGMGMSVLRRMHRGVEFGIPARRSLSSRQLIGPSLAANTLYPPNVGGSAPAAGTCSVPIVTRPDFTALRSQAGD